MEFTKAAIDALGVPEGKAELLLWDPGMPGFGVRLRRAGSKTWVCQYRIGGRQRRETLGDIRRVRLDDARKIARQRFASVELGVDPRSQNKPSISLGKAVQAYLDMKGAKWQPSSRQAATRYLKRYWKPLHDYALDNIGRADVAARLKELVTSKGVITASRARTHLVALYGWCIRQGLAEQNPAIPTDDPGAGRPPRSRTLDDDEIAIVWRACSDGSDFGKIVKLSLLLGTRREELGGLRWSDINFETRLLVIPSERTKTRRELRLTLPSMAREIIRSVPRREGQQFVFGNSKSGFVNWSYHKLALDARITAAHGKALDAWVLHDARRTCRSGLSRVGVRPDISELVLNHRRRALVAIYDHFQFADEIAEALRKWADHVAAVVDDRSADAKIVAAASLSPERAAGALTTPERP